MRRIARLFILLYPTQWRARCGEEFEGLIEDSSAGFGAMLDLLKEAIRMQMHVRSFPKLALILSATGLAAGFAMSWFITPVYMSRAEMQLSSAVASSSDVGPDLTQRLLQMQQQALSSSLAMIIQDPRLDIYKSERAHMPIERDRTDAARDIQVRRMPGGKPNVRF